MASGIDEVCIWPEYQKHGLKCPNCDSDLTVLVKIRLKDASAIHSGTDGFDKIFSAHIGGQVESFRVVQHECNVSSGRR